jgi:MYXO-CTERM domain-containing protein
MLCTPKLFSSVRKNVSPEGPPGQAPLLLLLPLLAVAVLLLRRPGDGEREVSDFGRAAPAVAGADADEGGEADAAKTSSKGRMAVRCAWATGRVAMSLRGGWRCAVMVELRDVGASHSEVKGGGGVTYSHAASQSQSQYCPRDAYLKNLMGISSLSCR